ncbi:hypothetical protein FOL47_010714 [Perkinsus chesapeaki]|uniref:Xylulose kinase n=1 Tax=Perkinsus chesapeaki TaxID=330153 RepID=A0A7J6L2K3_PERCH|nr:hypothetical protein FOL47_010714 [Perkinsus chesapeaki]
MSLYLGFDLSTQSCKAVVINHNLDTVYTTTVNFDKDLSSYSTTNGVSIKSSRGEVKSPSAMFSSAIQLCLERLQQLGCPMDKIVCVGGSGQQHGSVYLSSRAVEHILPASEDGNVDVGEWQNRTHAFTVENGPIWMDTSTSEECKELEDFIGGNEALAKLTGSKAWERICLVSSFCAGVLLGHPTSVDYSDAAGMNMMELGSRRWSREICGFIDGCNPDSLIDKLGGQPNDPMGIAGNVSPYWQNRYGFSPVCTVNYWSGDNPCAAVGMGLLNSGDILVSLGTSDTCLCVLPALPVAPPASAFILPHPIKCDSYVAMLVYTNGDVTRRDVKGSKSWTDFGKSISQSSPGAYVTLFTTTQEILPSLAQGEPITAQIESGKDGSVTFNRLGSLPQEGPDYSKCRAVVEERALSMRYYIDSEVSSGILEQFPEGRLLITGGGSRNEQIRQVFSDVFNREVIALDSPDAAALGAAYKAMLATAKANGSFTEAEQRLMTHISQTESSSRNAPKAEVSEVYQRMSQSYGQFERMLIEERRR